MGKHLRMSLTQDRTLELFRSFMPARKEISNVLTPEIFCMQVHDQVPDYSDFKPEVQFEKWAAMAVADFKDIPAGMETYTIKGGLYAVFIHKGPASEGDKTFRYIFTTWLPASIYELDHREHFELLGAKYKNNDPESEEEVWIPIRVRG